MSDQLPVDAIEVQDAINKYGHSWTWYRGKFYIYYTGSPRKGYVSESEVKTRNEKSQQVTVRKPV